HHDIHLTLTVSNSNPSITTSAPFPYTTLFRSGLSNATTNDPTASGQLTVHDVDSGENHFQAVAPASLLGIYGSFTFNATTGVWRYTVNKTVPHPRTEVEALHDHLIDTSFDGTA